MKEKLKWSNLQIQNKWKLVKINNKKKNNRKM